MKELFEVKLWMELQSQLRLKVKLQGKLTFNDGCIKMCDFAPMAQKGICTKLQNLDYFKSFKLDPFSVDWNNEIGFAPEYLYEKGQTA